MYMIPSHFTLKNNSFCDGSKKTVLASGLSIGLSSNQHGSKNANLKKKHFQGGWFFLDFSTKKSRKALIKEINKKLTPIVLLLIRN